MKNFLVSHLTQIATYATVIVIFTHNVLFDRDVACTCQGQKLHCNVYISVPIFIIILLLLWKDNVFNGTCRAYCCMKKRTKSQERFCHLILIQMGKASVIGLLWVVSVLVDGDWYACCQNGLPEAEAQIPCKTNRTLAEQAKVDNLKNESKVIGLGTLLGLLFLVVCFSLLKWCKCCEKYSSCFNCCKDCVYIDGDGPYELIIIQEEENVVNQILKERAKEALKQKAQEMLNKNKRYNYINYSDAAQQIIDQLWLQEEKGPSTSGDQSNNPPADPEKKEEAPRNEQEGISLSPVKTSSIHPFIQHCEGE